MTASADEVADAKAQLRATMKAARAAIPHATRRAGERAMAAALPAPVTCKPSVVASYRAIGDELDPIAIETVLCDLGHVIALPVMSGRGHPLTFRLWQPGDALIDRAWGIREPAPTARVVEPDILLVPLLAFDGAGHRLGYGGGYYDRTLARLRELKPIVAVGLAFGAQRLDAIPHLDYDQRLDWCWTPDGAVRAAGDRRCS